MVQFTNNPYPGVSGNLTPIGAANNAAEAAAAAGNQATSAMGSASTALAVASTALGAATTAQSTAMAAYPQFGTGAPSGISPVDALYVDTTTNKLYAAPAGGAWTMLP